MRVNRIPNDTMMDRETIGQFSGGMERLGPSPGKARAGRFSTAAGAWCREATRTARAAGLPGEAVPGGGRGLCRGLGGVGERGERRADLHPVIP